MLYVIYKNNTTLTFRIGNKIPNPCDVIMVQADCDELDRITDKWKGYPDHKTGVQYYYGDTAIQIALNWT